MRPIVDGLQEDYDGQIAFVYLNARDGEDGEAIFETLSLPGHPSYAIFTPEGEELFRSFGIVPEATLTDAIDKTLRE